MQLSNTKTEQEWLQTLQDHLIADRITETCQASPLYYAIQNIKSEVTASGYEDRTIYYDNDSCTDYDSLQDILTELKETKFDDIQELALHYEAGLAFDENDEIIISDEDDFLSYLEDHDYTICYMKDIHQIAPDTMFLTRNAAKEHLKANAHHYHPNAYTYAMTAWRSPEFEHLLELLFQIDWNHSHLELRVPKGWWHLSDIVSKLHMLQTLGHINEDQYKQLYNRILRCSSRINLSNQERYYNPNLICNIVSETLKELDIDTKTVPSFSRLYHVDVTINAHKYINSHETQTWVLDYYHEGVYHTLDIVKDKDDAIQITLKEKDHTLGMAIYHAFPYDTIIQLKPQSKIHDPYYIWLS